MNYPLKGMPLMLEWIYLSSYRLNRGNPSIGAESMPAFFTATGSGKTRTLWLLLADKSDKRSLARGVLTETGSIPDWISRPGR
jgi:hypothetical protein